MNKKKNIQTNEGNFLINDTKLFFSNSSPNNFNAHFYTLNSKTPKWTKKKKQHNPPININQTLYSESIWFESNHSESFLFKIFIFTHMNGMDNMMRSDIDCVRAHTKLSKACLSKSYLMMHSCMRMWWYMNEEYQDKCSVWFQSVQKLTNNSKLPNELKPKWKMKNEIKHKCDIRIIIHLMSTWMYFYFFLSLSLSLFFISFDYLHTSLHNIDFIFIRVASLIIQNKTNENKNETKTKTNTNINTQISRWGACQPA